MASYAAVVSLVHFLEQILHPSQHHIFLDKEQIQLLYQKVGWLKDFLEDYPELSRKQTDGLESRMTNIAYAAEDLIESHVLDQILSPSTAKSSTRFFQNVQELLEEMDLIQTDVIELKAMMGVKKDQPPTNSLSTASAKQAPRDQNATVGFQDKLIQIMDRLTEQESNRQIYTITGMGGIGKTTLARNVYDHPYIVHFFDLRAWVTVSQKYSVGEIILTLLNDINPRMQERFESDVQLEERLHKTLFDRRYLIVMDDIWSIEAWNEVKRFFPDNSNGSRILTTTRLSNVAVQCDSYSPFEMDFLSKEKSWELFCEKVFPQEGCPPELEEIGMNIVQKCRGLPLAIVVIGGFLAKSNKRQEYWEHVAENINSIINLDNDEHCLKLLSLSYSHLPIHLKPCFLYMATFPEDCEISVSRLIKLWVAEGFLKPISGKCLEDVAREYLKDLVDRNLILVRKRGIIGKIKSCIIHDLLRELCLRESQKENFLFVTNVNNLNIPPGIEGARRLSIHHSIGSRSNLPQIFLNALKSASLARSMVCEFEWTSPWFADSFRLLRVLDAADKFPKYIWQLVNLRYIALKSDWDLNSEDFQPYVFWNLQTITLEQKSFLPPITLPSEIWEMRQLRHLEFAKVKLCHPPCSDKGEQNSLILENLQTLFTVTNFKFTEDVIRRVPNMKKLKISYEDLEMRMGMEGFVHLHKLESFTCRVIYKTSVENLGFPNSLKKLILSGCELSWKDISIIGSLPNLEVLKLEDVAFENSKWYPVKGEFVKLKFLKIEWSFLVRWVAESPHFPCLEHLVLIELEQLEEIPARFGNLSTLRLIELDFCNDSAITSAKQILMEQESRGNEDFQVKVATWSESNEILSMQSENFAVKAGAYRTIRLKENSSFSF